MFPAMKDLLSLRYTLGVALALLLVAGNAPAQSQQPIPSPAKSGQLPQNHPQRSKNAIRSDDRGTENSPIVVKVLSTPKSNEEAIADAAEQKYKIAVDWRLVVFTGCLVIVGALQLIVFGLQAVWLRKTVYATQKSVHTFQASERPHIFVTVHKLDPFGSYDSWHTFPSIKVGVTLNNYGKTPAILTRARCIVRITNEFPNIFNEPQGDRTDIPEGLAVAPNDKAEYQWDFPNISASDWQNAVNNNLMLICYGIIQYKDIFDVIHETGFCWNYQNRIYDFYFSPTHKLNYRT